MWGREVFCFSLCNAAGCGAFGSSTLSGCVTCMAEGVRAVTPLPAPSEVIGAGLPDDLAAFVRQSRAAIAAILQGGDPRLLVVMGPCSVHSPPQALEYARRLQHHAQRCPGLLLVMRVYFECV